MTSSRLIRSCCLSAVVPLIAYWLFAQTVRRWAPSDRSNENCIRFSYWGNYDDHRMWQEIIRRFESAHAGIQVRGEWLPLSGYNTKLDQQMIAGDAPDLMMFQDEPFPRYAAEQFLPLDDFLAAEDPSRQDLADCWPTAPASFKFNGSLRGLPIMGGNVLIFCNLNAFERARRFRGRPVPLPAPDWTLSDFVETCRLLTFDEDGDGFTDQFGFMQPHWVYYLPFIWAHGAELTDENRQRWTLVGPQALAAFSLYADLRHRWGVTPMPSEMAGQNSDTAFLSGRVAMCVNGPWFQPFLRDTALADRYRVATIPRGPGGNATRVTWDGVCVYAKAPPRRQEQAWQFAGFLLTDPVQDVFARCQRGIPARRACARTFVACGGGNDSPAVAFIEAMDAARMQPITPAWHLIHQAMTRHMTSVLLEGEARRSPEPALAALAADPAIVQAFKGSTP